MPRSSRSRASAVGIAKSAKGQARATAASTRKKAVGVAKGRKPASSSQRTAMRAAVAKRFGSRY